LPSIWTTPHRIHIMENFPSRQEPYTIFVSGFDKARDLYASCLSTLGWRTIEDVVVAEEPDAKFAAFAPDEEHNGIGLFLRPQELTEQRQTRQWQTCHIDFHASTPLNVIHFHDCAMRHGRTSIWKPEEDQNGVYAASFEDYDGNVLRAWNFDAAAKKMESECNAKAPSSSPAASASRGPRLQCDQASSIVPAPESHEHLSQTSKPRQSHRSSSPRGKVPDKPSSTVVGAIASLVAGGLLAYLDSRDRKQDQRRKQERRERRASAQEHAHTYRRMRSQDRHGSGDAVMSSKRTEYDHGSPPRYSSQGITSDGSRPQDGGRRTSRDQEHCEHSSSSQASRRYASPVLSTPAYPSSRPAWIPRSPHAPLRRSPPLACPPSAYRAQPRYTDPPRRASDSDGYGHEYRYALRRHRTPPGESFRARYMDDEDGTRGSDDPKRPFGPRR